jgi:hypothetical protein
MAVSWNVFRNTSGCVCISTDRERRYAVSWRKRG